MKHALILALFVSSAAWAQDQPREFHVQVSRAIGADAVATFARVPASPVQGAPYSAAITNESIQTLADGNRIVQTSTGQTARDSLGRTRQDMPLPSLGAIAPANAPHLVIIQDPVAQASYTLNLTDKTAHKMAAMPLLPPPSAEGAVGAATAGPIVIARSGAFPDAGPPPAAFIQKEVIAVKEQAEVRTEDLGSKTLEGVLVNGVRTTRTIPAGQIGNDRPIEIVSEVWTSPELKTVVYSKRDDPRTGEQTFKLTNILRSDPDPSLFTVPPDFKLLDDSQPGKDVFFYRSVQ